MLRGGEPLDEVPDLAEPQSRSLGGHGGVRISRNVTPGFSGARTKLKFRSGLVVARVALIPCSSWNFKDSGASDMSSNDHARRPPGSSCDVSSATTASGLPVSPQAHIEELLVSRIGSFQRSSGSARNLTGRSQNPRPGRPPRIRQFFSSRRPELPVYRESAPLVLPEEPPPEAQIVTAAISDANGSREHIAPELTDQSS